MQRSSSPSRSDGRLSRSLRAVLRDDRSPEERRRSRLAPLELLVCMAGGPLFLLYLMGWRPLTGGKRERDRGA